MCDLLVPPLCTYLGTTVKDMGLKHEFYTTNNMSPYTEKVCVTAVEHTRIFHRIREEAIGAGECQI